MDAMHDAVPGLKSGQYGNHLRIIGAFRDQMHVGLGIVVMYCEIVRNTQPGDDRLCIINVDCGVRVIEAPGDDVEGVTELPCHLESPPPNTQVKGALSAIEESLQVVPTPLEGTEQTVESPEARTQLSMATPSQKDTHPKVLRRGEWRKVPDGYPRGASGQLERDQLFVNDLLSSGVACRL